MIPSGITIAAILATGYSPAIGFIHTGKQLSFVYEVADLYKVELTVPLAFEAARENPPNLERWVRLKCRDMFRERRLLQRVVPDIKLALGGSARPHSSGLLSALASWRGIRIPAPDLHRTPLRPAALE